MKKCNLHLIAAVSALQAALCFVPSAQTSITVNANSVVNDISKNPVGINIDYLMDDDRRIVRTKSTAAAIKEMKVGFLRYPGGEKSDNFLWSVSPYSSPRITAVRPNAWPTSDTRFYSNGTTGLSTLLDFDEFIVVCRTADAEPIICVAFDAMYKASSGGEVAPTKATLKQNAVEWVRYANVTKRYNIKYWTLGNETDYGDSYAGANPGASTYAADFAEFSQAMKAVDSTIKVGANGHSQGWFQTIFSTALRYVDFIEVHTYPTWDYSGYDQYRTSTPNFTDEVGMAQNAINTISNQADRDRLFIILSEINAISWLTSGGWPNQNDMGHALAVFDIIGQHLAISKLKCSLLWNTRWIDNDAAAVPVGLSSLFQTSDNVNFENGLSNWTIPAGGSITTTATEVHSGTGAIKATGNTAVFAYTNSIPANRLQPKTVYTAHVWAKVSGTANWSGVGYDFYFHGTKLNAGVGFTVNTASYTEYTKAFVTPDSFDQIQCWIYKTGSSDVCYVDDFSITQGAAPSVNDALDKNSSFNSNGRALAIWGQFLGHKLVSTTGSTTSIRTFATKDTMSGQINILLINKESFSQTVNVAVTGNNGATAASRSVFSGTGASDLTPAYQVQSMVPVTNNSLQATLPAFSITAFSLTRPVAVVEPLRVKPVRKAHVFSAYDLKGCQIIRMSFRSGIMVYRTASGLQKTVLVPTNVRRTLMGMDNRRY